MVLFNNGDVELLSYNISSFVITYTDINKDKDIHVNNMLFLYFVHCSHFIYLPYI
jgi:hypothetical protein